jgi:hypothetical protein
MEAIGALSDEVLRKQINDITSSEMGIGGSNFIPLGEPNVDDAMKFSAAMGGVGTGGSGNVSATANNMLDASKNVSGVDGELSDVLKLMSENVRAVSDKLDVQLSRSAGTGFEDKLSRFISSARERMAHLSQTLSDLASGPISQQDMMRIQFEVTQFGIVLDLSSKVGDKGSQALQTLFRNQ